MENPGIIPEKLASVLTGVFIGISSNDYSSYLLNRPVTDIDAYLATGNSHSTAAGIAGLMKVVLALKHKEIPPHLYFQQPSPYINWDGLSIKIPTVCTPWNVNKRLAGVSSFGFSGTNAHVILEQAPVFVEESSVERPIHVLTLGARSSSGLLQLARDYVEYFKRYPDVSWGDVCFSANTGRGFFEHRFAIVAGSVDDACVILNDFIIEP